jgi:hypothetical protein
VHLLESYEIPAIAYKGPTLAVSAYGNLSLRQFGDLDILVQDRAYERARQLLIKQGFRDHCSGSAQSNYVPAVSLPPQF